MKKPFSHLLLISLTISVIDLRAQVPGVTGIATTDRFGAIIRGRTDKKLIALVFTGDEFADGGRVVRQTLNKQKTAASFFLTGKFYSNLAFIPVIEGLRADGHYLGAHSDRHLLYADWDYRDSTLVTLDSFRVDLQNNYTRLAEWKIRKEQAHYFLPAFEWYNADIALWTKNLGLQLVNFSPGTSSTADYTYPEMGSRYKTSEVIYQSILDMESHDPHGLNGFILLVHIGTDPRRTDKFYNNLDRLITELKAKGYRFVRIDELLDN